MEAAYSSLGYGTLSIYQVTWKAVSFEWDLEGTGGSSKAQIAVQAALPPGPYDQVELLVLEIPVAVRNAV